MRTDSIINYITSTIFFSGICHLSLTLTQIYEILNEKIYCVPLINVV